MNPYQPPGLPGYPGAPTMPQAPPGYPPAHVPQPVPAAAAPYVPQPIPAAPAQPYPAYAQPAPAAAPQGYPGPPVPPVYAPPPQQPVPQAQPQYAPSAQQQYAPPPQAQPQYAPQQQYAPPAPAQPQYAPQPAPQAGGHRFLGIKLPGERYPDFAFGNHTCAIEKARISEDRNGVIVSFRYLASDVARPGDPCSVYLNKFGYRSQDLSGELVKLLLAALGCNTYEELVAGRLEQHLQGLGDAVLGGDENALAGKTIVVRAWPHSPKKGDHVGKTFVKSSFEAYRPT